MASPCREMTRKQIEVMQAYIKGETIECRCTRFEKDMPWEVIKAPAWEWGTTDYRVKEKIKSLREVAYDNLLESVKAAVENVREYLDDYGLNDSDWFEICVSAFEFLMEEAEKRLTEEEVERELAEDEED